MSRERLFRVRSARSGGGRSRCRVVYRPAFRNMGQLFRPRAFRVAFPLSCAEYSGGRFCVLPRSGARLLFKESVESGESSRQGTTVRDALPPNRAGVSVRRHMFSCAGLAYSCGFRPDGPVLSLSCSRPGFCTRRLRLAVAGRASGSDLAPNPCRRRRARAGSRAHRKFDGRHREN